MNHLISNLEEAGEDARPEAAMKEGDIFRWEWTEARKQNHQKFWGDSSPYHCKSRIAVFQDGRLMDTFWGGTSDSGYLKLEDVELTFLGNPADMTKIYPAERVFYRDEDVVSMQHSNNSGAPVYVKGPRDAETMKAYFARQVEKTNHEIDWAHRRIAECQENIARVERGEIDGSFAVYAR